MPIPSVIADLSTTASSNSPQGNESPTEGDNYLRAIQAILKREHDDIGTASSAGVGAGMVGFATANTYAGSSVGGALKALGDRITGVVVSIADYGASAGASGTTNTTAISSAASAINSAGGGVLVFPSGTFSIWPTLPGSVLCDFDSCANVTILNFGATLDVGYSWSGSETQSVFQFTDCDNLFLDLPALASTVQTAGSRATRGPKFLTLAGNSENIHIPRIKATGALWVVGASALSSATESQRCRNIHIGTGYADRCGYGTVWQFSGDNVHIGQWYSNGPHRSYFAYGVRNHVVNIESRDQDADDCLLRSYEGKGLDNIKLNYTNTKSTAAQSAAPCVSLAFGDQTAATIRDVDVHIRAHWPSSNYFGYAFHAYKNDNGGGYDSTERGHTLAGLKVSGVLSSDYSSAVPIRAWVDGTWGTTESLRGISFRDLVITGADASTVALGSAKDCAQFFNVDTDAGLYVQSAPSGYPAKLINCRATNFTSGTSDTGYADYMHCEATSGSLQSVSNKTFAEFTVAGVLVRDFGKIGRGLLVASNTKFGDLTGTNNIFFVKLSGGLGAYFRLRYALVADQSDTSAATRDETYGCKSFSATMNGPGVWTSQTAASNEVTERTLGTASSVTVSLVNGTSAGAHIAVACTNYSGTNARASYVLEVMPMGAEAVLTNRCEAV